MLGGLTQRQPINDEVRDIAHQHKGAILNHIQSNSATFEPIEFATQVVAGVNYHVKIRIDNDEFIHVKIYEDLQGKSQVTGVQRNKGRNDAF